MEFIKGMVSICIPTYNGAEYIKECIESVLAQDYENMEIIINDDCSSDNTLEVVRSIDDSRIKIFQNEKNQGLVGGWIAAIDHATGEYTKLLCQDDILCEGAISKQVSMLKNNPDSHLCIGNTYVIGPDSQITMDRHRFDKDEYINGKAYAKKSFMGRNIYSEPPNALYYTEDYYKVGKYDVNLAYTVDWDFTLMLSYLGPIAVTKDYIMKFRVSGISETSRLYAKRLKNMDADHLALLKKHIKIGEVKISGPQRLLFRCVTWAGSRARYFVMKRNR